VRKWFALFRFSLVAGLARQGLRLALASGFSHARNWAREDSAPKMAFGKIGEANARRMMAFSVEVHHAMMDGITVGRYLDRLQEMLLQPADFMSSVRAEKSAS